MKKLTFDEVIQLLADEMHVDRAQVRASALRRKVWVSGAGYPGCLYDSGPNYSVTKKDAIENLLFIADTGDGAPRGMASALRAYHSFSHENWVYEVSQDTLGSIL